MIYPQLSEQQKKDITKFLQYLTEQDADWILSTGDAFPTFHHLRKKIHETVHINLFGKPRHKSGLTYGTANAFAKRLGMSIMATAKAACEASGKYNWHVINEINEFNQLGWSIIYYNDEGC